MFLYIFCLYMGGVERGKHVDNGVRTYAKFVSHIYHRYPVICKSAYLPCVMYYKSAFVVVYM